MICNFWGSEINVLGFKKVDLSSLLFTNLTAAVISRADVLLFQMFLFCDAGSRLQLEGNFTLLRERNFTKSWGGKEERQGKFFVDWFPRELKVLLTSHLVLFADFPVPEVFIRRVNLTFSSITLWELHSRVFTWTTTYWWQSALQEYQSNIMNSIHWTDWRAQLHHCGSRMSLTLCWTVKQI